jgi:glycosyltransferase involved in cell wall biosynthesis
MKIALCSTTVPFVESGARQIVEWLEENLREYGHSVERVYLPEVDQPWLLYRQMMAFRWVDLEAADRVICFRPQSHMIPHPNKVLWFIHHVRVYYDLWDSPYRQFKDDDKHRGIRDAIRAADNAAISEARAVFTNSAVVSDRLKKYNGVESEVLYPPLLRPERFFNRGSNDEIVYVSRIEHHKRQHLLVEALRHTKAPVKLRLCGTTTGDQYPRELRQRILDLGLGDRVSFDNRWVTEDEKASHLADCLAAAYVPVDEDSYGYPTLEAAHSSKPMLTASDSGGVLEFVQDGVNGYVSEPTPLALAEAMDKLFLDRAVTERMGRSAADRVRELGVAWPNVIERLLA